MNAEPKAVLLLRDALERVIANPTASHLWHGLRHRYEGVTDADTQLSVCQSLMRHVPAEGIAGFLSATFLAWVAGRTEYVADAGRLVQTIKPVDPERLMAFTAFEWGRALANEGDRSQFVTQLREAGLPEIVHLAGLHLSRHTAVHLPARAIDRVRKVALVASFIGLAGHTPTELALQHARIMQELGLEVRVFSCQELLLQDMPQYLGNMGCITTAAPDMEGLVRLVPPGVKVTIADERFSLMRRWQDMLGAMAEFDPDLVFFIGLHSPLLTPLYATRPVLGLCVHSIAPMAPVDVWLTASQSLVGVCGGPWGPALPPAWGHYHPYRIALKPAGAPIAREQLGVTERDLVLVTVGARLESEITAGWAARMCELLLREPRLVWLLVGGAGTAPQALADVAPSQLRLFAHREDLRGVLRCCDIYLNPPRLGGGFSVAEAMAEGVPVIAFANSDGGNKLSELAVNTTEAYFERVQALIDQPTMRVQAGAAMRTLFSDTLNLDRSGQSLLEACSRTIALFRHRAALMD